MFGIGHLFIFQSRETPAACDTGGEKMEPIGFMRAIESNGYFIIKKQQNYYTLKGKTHDRGSQRVSN